MATGGTSDGSHRQQHDNQQPQNRPGSTIQIVVVVVVVYYVCVVEMLLRADRYYRLQQSSPLEGGAEDIVSTGRIGAWPWPLCSLFPERWMEGDIL